MAVLAGDVDGNFHHVGCEGDAGDPADEADDGEDAENEEDDAAAILSADDVVDAGGEGEDDVQDARDPYEELGEVPRTEEVGIREGESHAEDEDEEHEGVGVKGEVVGCIIDAAAAEAFVFRIAMDGHTGHGHVAEEDGDELPAV